MRRCQIGTLELPPGQCEAGQILVVLAAVPHKFSGLGPGRLEAIAGHASEQVMTGGPE